MKTSAMRMTKRKPYLRSYWIEEAKPKPGYRPGRPVVPGLTRQQPVTPALMN